MGEIINETGFDKGIVSRYLSILERLHITRKEIPVTEKMPEKSRKGFYLIDDNFFNFWFRFVFRNKLLLEGEKVEPVLSKVEKELAELLARDYEKIARDIIQDTRWRKRMPAKFNEFGRWWDKNGEIDLVGLNSETNEILFGEVKWSSQPVGIAIS